MPVTTFRRLAAAVAVAGGLLAAGSALAQASAAAPTKVTVSMLFITADVGVFLGVEKGYYKEQGLEIDMQRMTSAADAIALLATDKLDVGSGGCRSRSWPRSRPCARSAPIPTPPAPAASWCAPT